MPATLPAHNAPGMPSEGSPAIRLLVRWLSRRCLQWVYREIRIIGAEQVPKAGAALFMGNHPNDLPDVLLGYRVTGRPLRYIATISAASSWAARKVLDGLGVIQVVRVRDARVERRNGTDISAVNAAAGEAVGEALASGHAVGVFPEGGVHNTPYVGRPRMGVARMLLEYLDSGARNDVAIVPFGVQYEAPHRPGSDCIVVVGTPFSLRGWLNEQPARASMQARQPASAMVQGFHQSLQQVTRNSASWEQANVRDRLVASAAAALATRDPLAVSIGLVWQAQRVLENPGSVSVLGEHGVSSEHAVRIRTCADALASALENVGGIGTSSRDHFEMRRAAAGGSTQPEVWYRLIIGAPFAVLGWLIHGPVFVCTWRLAQRFAKAPVDLVAATMLTGVLLVPLWYLLLAAILVGTLVGVGLVPWTSVLLGVLLIMVGPRLGDAAVAWRWQWRRWRLMCRTRALPMAEREYLSSLYLELALQWATATADFGGPSIKLPEPSDSTLRHNPAAGSSQV